MLFAIIVVIRSTHLIGSRPSALRGLMLGRGNQKDSDSDQHVYVSATSNSRTPQVRIVVTDIEYEAINLLRGPLHPVGEASVAAQSTFQLPQIRHALPLIESMSAYRRGKLWLWLVHENPDTSHRAATLPCASSAASLMMKPALCDVNNAPILGCNTFDIIHRWILIGTSGAYYDLVRITPRL